VEETVMKVLLVGLGTVGEAIARLIASGVWQGSGVRSVESFDPDPYLAILDRDGFHHATIDIEPGGAFA
jgi:saccharopine dehydrogenase-like NADP-dependent oxidoreductase